MNMTMAQFSLPDFKMSVRMPRFVTEVHTDLMRKFKRNQLERELAKILKQFKGHRLNKSPKHAPVYQLLWQKAEAAITKFCSEYSVPESEIYTQVPALNEVKAWGQLPTEAAAKAGKTFVVGLIAVPVLLFLIGMGGAFGSRLIVLGNHLVHHILG